MDEESTNPVLGTEETTSAESSTEEETVEGETGSQPENQAEEQLPWHKQKRWIAREEKLKAYESELGQTRAEMEELRAFKQQMESRLQGEEEVEIPEEFKVAFGEDPEAFKAVDGYFARKLEQYEAAKAEKAEMESKAKAEENAKWEAWTDSQMDALEGEGKVFDRNALLKVMLDNSEADSLYNVYDKDGNFDFKKGLQILEKSGKPDSTEAKKAISDKTRGTGEAGKKDFLTWAETKKMGWN